MTRRRWVYINSEAVEVSEDYAPTSRNANQRIVGDLHYANMWSPIDGSDISTRAKHKEHMKRHGVTTSDDFQGTWAKAGEEREKSFAGYDPSRKKDVDYAIHKVQQGYKPRRQPEEG